MNPTLHTDRFRYTRSKNQLLQLLGEGIVTASIITALSHYATTGITPTGWNPLPMFVVTFVAGLLLLTLRSRIHIPQDSLELVESRTVLGLPLTEKRSQMEFNKIVVERDWQAGDDPQPVQYIVKLVGPKSIFYVDEVTHFSSAEQLATALAKTLNVSVVTERSFSPHRKK